MIRWTGLAPWEFEFPFPGSLTSTFLGLLESPSSVSSIPLFAPAGAPPCAAAYGRTCPRA